MHIQFNYLNQFMSSAVDWCYVSISNQECSLFLAIMWIVKMWYNQCFIDSNISMNQIDTNNQNSLSMTFERFEFVWIQIHFSCTKLFAIFFYSLIYILELVRQGLWSTLQNIWSQVPLAKKNWEVTFIDILFYMLHWIYLIFQQQMITKCFSLLNNHSHSKSELKTS